MIYLLGLAIFFFAWGNVAYYEVTRFAEKLGG